MTLVPAGILDDLRNTVNSSLIDTGTVTRTGAVLPCRVDIDTSEARVHGLPVFFKAPKWQITFPWRVNNAPVDLAIGDEVTIAGNVYHLLEAATFVTYGVSTVVQSVLASVALNPFQTAVSNADVQFRRTNAATRGYDIAPPNPTNLVPPPTIGAYVQIDETAPVLTLYGEKLMYRVFFPFDIAINGRLIQENDEIVWDQLRKGWATLLRPVRYYGPVRYASALFEATA